MSFLGLKIPHETARLLGEIDVPGKREGAAELHVTILFLGESIPIEMLARAIVATYKVTSVTLPFIVSTSRVTSFPPGDDGTPIICSIQSQELHTLHDKLARSLEAHGVPFSKKFPIYAPHVTLAYADEAIEDRPLPTVEWGAHELVLWGGDSNDNRLVVSFPLTLNPGLTIAQKVAQRFRAAVL
jgi:2'-5' RNA ligase